MNVTQLTTTYLLLRYKYLTYYTINHTIDYFTIISLMFILPLDHERRQIQLHYNHSPFHYFD